MAQFTLKRLLTSVTIAAFGFALFAYSLTAATGGRSVALTWLSAIIVGMSAGTLYRQPFDGAIAGATFGMAAELFAAILYSLHRSVP